ncbi:MAG: ADP-glyceromanno-heptose 6-epimerase [Acidobacteria bacterium]|nr:ADP-glyceromanno-heptose 6-epimerase [Acidobacteriota bacterium]
MVVVTGAAGFIGARLVQALRAQGLDVTSVDHGSHFDTRPEHADVEFGTRLEPERAVAWLQSLDAPPRAIVHLGACTDTREQDVAYLTRVNLRASQELWRYASDAGVPFIYASSAATYGAGEHGYDDDERLVPRLKPLNKYGESKQQFDLWALDEARAGAHPPAWCGLKFFNVYGFGERHKGPMASVVLHAYDQIAATGRVRLFRSHEPGVPDGHQARDFVFVDDVVDVLAWLVRQPTPRGIFNLGTGKARTFLDLARAVFAAVGQPERIDFIDTPEDVRRHYQYFTEARMDRLLAHGYARPFTTLEDGVASYVRSLRTHAAASAAAAGHRDRE